MAKERKEIPEGLSAKDLLRTLPGLEIRELESPNEALKGKDLFEVTVDKERLQMEELNERQILILLHLFGEAAVQIYGPRDKPQHFDIKNKAMRKKVYDDDIAGGDLGIADRILIISEGNKIDSFLAMELIEDEDEKVNKKIGYLCLDWTAPEARGKGFAKELLKTVLAEKDIDAFVSVSSTPAAAKLEIDQAKEAGLAGYYGGCKNGERGNLGPEDEKQQVQAIMAEFIGFCKDDELLAVPPEETPYGYAIYDHKIGPIPPLREKEVHFPPNHPLDKLFREELLPLQKKHLPHTVYGIGTLLRHTQTSKQR